ncbi:MAG: hypothetical protein WD492_01090 [Alkalispirochaeta sp.]
MRNTRYGSALVLAVLLITSCASVDERYVAGEQFDHRGRRRHAEPALVMERSGTEVAVTTPWLPGTELFGIIDETTVYVTGVRLFANWANGWTEAFFEASGTITVEPTWVGEQARFSVHVEEPVELWTLYAGGIRYYDTYLLGEDGLIRVRGRVNRMREVAEWMREQGGPDSYGSDSHDGAYGPAMVDDVRRAVDADIDAGTAPEWLIPLYESQSLERDLREASDMLVALYNLERFNGRLLDSLTLETTK